MDKKQLIEKAGNQKALAQLLGISQAAISQWKTVPEARIWQCMALKPEWFEAKSETQLP
jgi:predicted transcriptional regulator